MLRPAIPLCLLLAACAVSAEVPSVHFATGIKIVEPAQDRAMVWVRLTRDAAAADRSRPLPEVAYWNAQEERWDTAAQDRHEATIAPRVTLPAGLTVADLPGAAQGAPGEVRVRYRGTASETFSETAWMPVAAEQDYTRLIPLTGLTPGTTYTLSVEGRAPGTTEACAVIAGQFRTTPAVDHAGPVRFAVSTGQRYPHRDGDHGWDIYPAMEKLNLDFFVHTGDVVYYDVLGKSPALARWHWQRTYSSPTNVAFHTQVASYFIKDDHDTLMNDCWPGETTKYMGELTWEDGQAIFREQTGLPSQPYRTVRCGKELQIWLVEGRDFRSPNTMTDGPDKTIWGAAQMAWFQRTVQESDAAFRVLISPTPVVGPDRDRKNDNHANEGFATEGRALRAFLAAQPNMFVVCGDRHWQYESQDEATGLYEYSCGPASEAHAGGWKESDRRPEHKFLAVHGGFLSVTTTRDGDQPSITFRHHAPDGSVRHERVHTVKR
jgi:alkaline phosphatase D